MITPLKRLARACVYPALILGVTASCSLLVKPKDHQCDSTPECQARAGIFSTFTCVDGLCVKPGDIGVSGCTSNSKCVQDHAGLPYICLAPNTGTDCTAILSKECTFVDGAYDADDALLLGHFTLNGEFASEGKKDIAALMMAFNEIQNYAGGVPVNGKRRPVALVSCGLDTIDVGGKHLTEDLHVPAVLGLNSATGLTLFNTKYVKQNQVFVMTVEGSIVNSNLDDNGLVWRNSPDDNGATTVAQYIPQLEPQIKTERSKTAIKVAMLVWQDDTDLVSYAQNVTDSLIFNGVSVKKNSDAGNFKRIDYPINVTPFNDTAIVTQLLDYRPDIILGINGVDMVNPIMVDLETSWGGGDRPYYVGITLGEPGFGIEPVVGQIQDNGADIVRRIRGLQEVFPDTPTTNEYLTGFAALNNGDSPRPYRALYYETAYLTAYAIAAAGNTATLTGTAIAEGMQKISQPGKTAFALGPGDGQEINKVLTTVPFTPVSFTGPTGPITFNQKGNRSANDFTVHGFCFQKNAQGAWAYAYSGQSVDKSYNIVGTYKCPTAL